MNITLMAHDKKKELMVQFCTAYKSILSKHSISATATTGRLVAEATGLPVSLFLSKNQGGHQQIDARIAYNEVDMVILFNDPNDTDPWEDQRMVHTIHLCDTYNVPLATNLASAEMLILGLQRGDLDPAIIPVQTRKQYRFNALPERRPMAERALRADPGRTSAERTIPYPKEGRLRLLNLGGTTECYALVPNIRDESIFL